MVSSPLNIAYSIEELQDKCQCSIFIGHQTKEPEKIGPLYGLATQMDYNVQATEIRSGGQCRGKTFTTRIRGNGMESGMYGQEEKKWLTIKGVYLLRPLVH